MKTHLRIAATALSICAAVSGCAGTVWNPVLEANKDPSFQYDGMYVATVNKSGGTQFVENWEFKCTPQEFDFQFEVNKSVVYIGANDGFVNKDGRFRLLIPTQDAIQTSVLSESSIYDGRVTLIIQGKLNEAKPFGYYVQGIKQFNNQGCTYPMNFKKELPTATTQKRSNQPSRFRVDPGLVYKRIGS